MICTPMVRIVRTVCLSQLQIPLNDDNKMVNDTNAPIRRVHP